MVLREFTKDETERLMTELERRLRRLEQLESDVLKRNAPRAPVIGKVWMDIEAGKLRIWNGTSWDSFTKD